MGEMSYKGEPLTLLSLVAPFKWIPYYLNCVAVFNKFSRLWTQSLQIQKLNALM
jgi:hypothetical protein